MMKRAERGAVQAMELGHSRENDSLCGRNQLALIVFSPIVENVACLAPANAARVPMQHQLKSGLGWHVDQLVILPLKVSFEDFCHDRSIVGGGYHPSNIRFIALGLFDRDHGRPAAELQ